MTRCSNHEIERIHITSGMVMDIAKRLAGEKRVVALTTLQGKPVLAAMPWDLYESIIETMETMGDVEMLAALRRGVEDSAGGHPSKGDSTESKDWVNETWGIVPADRETIEAVMKGPSYLDV